MRVHLGYEKRWRVVSAVIMSHTSSREFKKSARLAASSSGNLYLSRNISRRPQNFKLTYAGTNTHAHNKERVKERSSACDYPYDIAF